MAKVLYRYSNLSGPLVSWVCERDEPTAVPGDDHAVIPERLCDICRQVLPEGDDGWRPKPTLFHHQFVWVDVGGFTEKNRTDGGLTESRGPDEVVRLERVCEKCHRSLSLDLYLKLHPQIRSGSSVVKSFAGLFTLWCLGATAWGYGWDAVSRVVAVIALIGWCCYFYSMKQEERPLR